mmetsp:Transcript_3858/g.8026  ORF Transcript_3858/g.8026 Transcript_3858/m.8026 type:complete len:467 (-) Transcript_3858:403-1803(-)|eukprot:CAMPEP_0119478482 /NCGR_PEP_ID=MMETSP1344-20130328/8193_1 /TAXON_ID=236787 /ORGANISM="Florenciella parvula, Strain CCMP2471" /LENGTH=466 /DNA_ID=CAMNT_0007512655 /DNA_START=53 /DNA_END=1453 /DNA_ORIENTATION=+
MALRTLRSTARAYRTARTTSACFASEPTQKPDQRGYMPPNPAHGTLYPTVQELTEPRTSVLLECNDNPGALHEILKYFWKYDINITHIESRPSKNESFEFFVDFHATPNAATTSALLDNLKKETRRMLVLDARNVPWFPRHVSDLDVVANRILDAGTDLESDHPGFNDPVYRERRVGLAENAMNHRFGNPIPHISYSEDELATWKAVYERLETLLSSYACSEYLKILPMMKQHCGYSADNIPQQADISNFLQRTTGFQLRPVAGLLSSRDFLNGLAFRTFFCTQYIRHHSMPLYTPEPDIVHELMGHAPMFADPDFAEFSQEIGLASLGASDKDIERLARCYWHSVEFGVCREDGQLKAYGAGLLSSFGELEYSCAPYRPAGDADEYPELLPWDPVVAAETDFPITTYQPTYFVAQNLADAKQRMRKFCESMNRPFYARYNSNTQGVWVDRAVALDEQLAVEANPY